MERKTVVDLACDSGCGEQPHIFNEGHWDCALCGVPTIPDSTELTAPLVEAEAAASKAENLVSKIAYLTSKGQGRHVLSRMSDSSPYLEANFSQAIGFDRACDAVHETIKSALKTRNPRERTTDEFALVREKWREAFPVANEYLEKAKPAKGVSAVVYKKVQRKDLEPGTHYWFDNNGVGPEMVAGAFAAAGGAIESLDWDSETSCSNAIHPHAWVYIREPLSSTRKEVPRHEVPAGTTYWWSEDDDSPGLIAGAFRDDGEGTHLDWDQNTLSQIPIRRDWEVWVRCTKKEDKVTNEEKGLAMTKKDEKLKAGDQVVLKSGGPIMTLGGYSEESSNMNIMECYYTAEGSIEIVDVHRDALVKVEEVEESKPKAADDTPTHIVLGLSHDDCADATRQEFGDEPPQVFFLYPDEENWAAPLGERALSAALRYPGARLLVGHALQTLANHHINDALEDLGATATRELDHARNLLAVLHGDGGHHTEKVGFIRACQDAERAYHERFKKLNLELFELKQAAVEFLEGKGDTALKSVLWGKTKNLASDDPER